MFAKDGISVLAFDLRGHGKTPGKPGDTSDYNKFIYDIDLLIKQGKKIFKNKPLFLYGHSFGGNLAANYAISNLLDISGLILTSPWLELSYIPPRHKVIMAGILSRFLPGARASSGLKPEDLSRELRIAHNYRNDPHVHNKISVGLFMKAYENGMVAKRSIYKINVPLLVLHGTADNITSYKASREFVMNSGAKTNFIEIEGGYHELHNDSDKEKVFKTIYDWISEHIK
jgi:alpha-beta hydrolase superfamily lysophospholipase